MQALFLFRQRRCSTTGLTQGALSRRASFQLHCSSRTELLLPTVNGHSLSWGGLQKHGVKKKFEFLTFFETRLKGRNVNDFLPQPPLLDQSNARTRRSKTCQKYARTRVHRRASSGKHAGSEGWIHTHAPVPTMPRKWSHESQTPPPPTKGCKQPGPKKVKNSVKISSHSKMVLPAVPAMFFSHKNFSHIFHCVARGFFDGFSRFFRTFFRTIFRTVFLAEFFAPPFYAFF